MKDLIHVPAIPVADIRSKGRGGGSWAQAVADPGFSWGRGRQPSEGGHRDTVLSNFLNTL